ncbi:hypothetical protein [Hydrogenibacillus schlegelii]|nr:hypothetical protein [Hydrogenibacillus schlegelii]
MEHALTKALAKLDLKEGITVAVLGDVTGLRRFARAGRNGKTCAPPPYACGTLAPISRSRVQSRKKTPIDVHPNAPSPRHGAPGHSGTGEATGLGRTPHFQRSALLFQASFGHGSQGPRFWTQAEPAAPFAKEMITIRLLWSGKDLFMHMLIIGPPRSGKTSIILKPMIYQLFKLKASGVLR